ncbi:hypothetical protein G7054_g5009 [Neopestalotiopsis clavispora]|nr:hypothetical protein G7054_g5009 [Neopestalotiopsis clavispora]
MLFERPVYEIRQDATRFRPDSWDALEILQKTSGQWTTSSKRLQPSDLVQWIGEQTAEDYTGGLRVADWDKEGYQCTLERMAGVRTFSDSAAGRFIDEAEYRLRDTADLRAQISDLLNDLGWLGGNFIQPVSSGLAKVQEHAKSADQSSTLVQVQLAGEDLEERMQHMQQEHRWLVAIAECYASKTDTTISVLNAMCVLQGNNQNLALNKQNFQLGQQNFRIAEQSGQLAKQSQAMTDQAVDIALETKKDSSMMTSIAFLTAIFLPGTFVGTILATPMITWDQRDLWKYWAITIPLTFFVVVFWLFWMRRVQRKVGNLPQREIPLQVLP